MPTPDASQFTSLKKYSAIDARANTYGPKQITHLTPYVPTALRPIDFLPSFTNKSVSPGSYLNINYAAGHGSSRTTYFPPAGSLTSDRRP